MSIADRFNLCHYYLKNNRIKEYREIIGLAKKYNYKIIPMSQARDSFINDKDSLVMVLRHDVDWSSSGTLKMAAIEREYDVQATYYFRWNTFQPEVLKQVAALKQEISFHYETLATVISESGQDKVDLTEDFLMKCRFRLKEELNQFKALCNEIQITPCLKTIASHGHPLNRLYNFSNNKLVSPDYYDFFNIEHEAYDPVLIENTDLYISDQVIEINHGYRYGIHPLDAIKKKYRRIIFLTHPNHWYYSPFNRLKKIIKCFILGSKNTKQVFKY